MTVGELIDALEALPTEAAVLLASDPEGNTIWTVDEAADEHDGTAILWPGVQMEA